MLKIEDLEVDITDASQDASDLIDRLSGDDDTDSSFTNVVLILGQLDATDTNSDGTARWTAEQGLVIAKAKDVLAGWENQS